VHTSQMMAVLQGSQSSRMLKSITAYFVTKVFGHCVGNGLPSDTVQHLRRSKTSTTAWQKSGTLHVFIPAEQRSSVSETTTQTNYHPRLLSKNTLSAVISIHFYVYIAHQLLNTQQ